MPEIHMDAPASVIVDAHLDVAYNAVTLQRDLGRPVDEIREHERHHSTTDPGAGTCTVSWPALRDGRVAIIGGSLFVQPARKSRPVPTATYRTAEEAHSLGAQQLDYYHRMSDERDDVALVLDTGDLDRTLASWDTEDPAVGVFVVMEGADPIREPDEVGWWIERGVRGIALAWASGSRYAGGNANPGPLTDEGEVLIRLMADHNLLLDVSHLWEDALYRVLDRYPGPIVATHANPRAFVDMPRALADDVIRQIGEREGVVGVVAYNRMLSTGWRPGDPRVPLNKLVEAIDHICQVTGHAGTVGLGSDLDGGFGREAVPEGLDSVADLPKIGALLGERGYSPSDTAAILSGNWLRVMRRVLEAF